MNDCTLTITIDADSVRQIFNAGQYVTVLQSVNQFVQNEGTTLVSTPTVATAWLAFRPFENNTITWSSSYQLFASHTAPVNGNVVLIPAAQSAVAGIIYPFQNGSFQKAAAVSMPGYLVQNLEGSPMTFGLALAASVNDVQQAVSPICVATLLPDEIGRFNPRNFVAVLLSTLAKNGTVFQPLEAPVYYSMSSGNASLQYQASDSSFVPTITGTVQR